MYFSQLAIRPTRTITQHQFHLELTLVARKVIMMYAEECVEREWALRELVRMPGTALGQK